MEGIAAHAAEGRASPAQVVGEPPLFDVVFTAEEVRDYRSTLRADAALQKHFNALLRRRGILKGDSNTTSRWRIPPRIWSRLCRPSRAPSPRCRGRQA